MKRLKENLSPLKDINACFQLLQDIEDYEPTSVNKTHYLQITLFKQKDMEIRREFRHWVASIIWSCLTRLVFLYVFYLILYKYLTHSNVCHKIN